MLLDAHIHIDQYSKKSLIEFARQCSIYNVKIFTVSMCIPSYLKILDMSKQYDFIQVCFGIHPWKADIYSSNLEQLDRYLYDNKYIGEIGLDKKFLDYTAPYKDQQEVFEYIISHKATKGKLLNLHTSGAESEVLYYLRKYNCNNFIVHWYSGPLDLINEYLSLGGYFTIGTEILFSEHIQNLVKYLPLDRMLLETDGPHSYSWLSGDKNYEDDMPELLLKIIDKICEIKNQSKDIFLQQLYKNQAKVLS